MATHHYLTLDLCRLKSGQAWSNGGEGLLFVFVSGGAGQCGDGCPTQPLLPGDVLVLHAGNGCCLSATKGADLLFWFFCAGSEHLFPLWFPSELGFAQGLLDSFKAPKRYLAANPSAVRWHRMISDVPPQHSVEHRGQLLGVAAAILGEEFKNLRAVAGRYVTAAENITRTFEHLSVEEILSLSVPELAARFHCCPRQLNRLFHAHFGLAVGALRMELRLLKAAALLRNQDFKVCHVAEQCGFNHLGLFNVCFKRRFSVSPSQWRQQFVEPATAPVKVAAGDTNCALRTYGLCPWTHRSGKAKPVLGRSPGVRPVRRWGDEAVVLGPWRVPPPLCQAPPLVASQ
jgi:AraC-like DNA-binding protein